MTNEERQLLLQDLCARLPYGVKVIFRQPQNSHSVIEILRDVEIRNADVLISTTTWNNIELEVCKPLLRPMESMTEEENARRCAFLDDIEGGIEEAISNYIDWLNENKFDYRGLIPMGLALPATEGMYKTV